MTDLTKVEILFNGFSEISPNGEMTANCSCTLIQTPSMKMIVDTMTAWDGPRILQSLADRGIQANQITYAVATHGHSDHLGNLNLFLNAKHIVGTSMNSHETYFDVFEDGEALQITDGIEIIATPGHTESCISVVVSNTEQGTIAICGDLFEKRQDSWEPDIWEQIAGSVNPLKQQENRLRILRIANQIIPGHGGPFAVTPEILKLNEDNLLKLQNAANPLN